MVALVYRAVLLSGQGWLDVGLRDIEIRDGGSGYTLYSMSGPGGGLAGWRLEEGHLARLGDTHVFNALEGQAARGGFLEMGDAIAIATGATLIGFSVETGGGIGARQSWDGLQPVAGDMALLGGPTGETIYAADTAGGAIRGYHLTAPDRFGDLGVLQSARAIIEFETITLSGNTILLALDRLERGVFSYQVDAGTGDLMARAQLGAGQGLGVMEPVALETVTIGSAAYAVLASGGTGSGALSVMQVRSTGQLEPVDHVLDTRFTRFGQVQDLAVAASDDRAYVVAGGGDDGLSLFVMLETGRLVYLHSLAMGDVPGLAAPGALSAVRIGQEIQVFSAGGQQTGLVQFSLSLAAEGVSGIATEAGGSLTGSDQDDILVGGAGDDALTAGAGVDILVDGAGTDTLSGGAGADIYVLEADGARDLIHGFEPGLDRLDLSGFTMLYDPGQLGFTSRAGGAELSWRGEVTEIFSQSGASLSLFDIFGAGFEGPDRPPLGMGETITGGSGADILGGRWWGDSLEGRDGNDVIRAGGGDDRLYGGNGFDTLYGGDGADRIWGGNGRDRVYMGSGDDLYFDNAQGGDLGRDTVFGGYGNDTIEGGAGHDAFHGMYGNDLLYARLGNDRLYGGDGFDTLYGGDGADRIWGGNGRDRVYMGSGDDLYFDNAQGGDLGRDTVFGGYGNDTIEGGAGHDAFYGMVGHDLVRGRLGNDHLFGGEGNDVLDGGQGADRLYGGAGGDMLIGGPGADRLYGGAGADVFVFGPVAGADQLVDFIIAEDVIRFTGTGLDFSVLNLVAQGGGVEIHYGANTLWLDGVQATALQASDFEFL